MIGPASLIAFTPLPIFPETGLNHSILTTVLVGLIIMVLFNEWLGWPLSGVVVPGYLGPILLIQPLSGVLIIVEAILTHLLFVGFGVLAPRLGVWKELFGRDRFFAYLLFGTLVRLFVEGVLVEVLGQILQERFGLAFDYRNTLYSVGLIVVPLLANMFYKPGVLRGLGPVVTTIGVTILAVRFVLIPLTNFSIASFEITYGHYATELLGNAKAYIIILVTAYMASRSNLLYGWDYNGILIPALIALAWFEPLKVATTILESIFILVIAKVVTSHRIFRDVTIEAGRKILLCFSIGYAIKLVAGFAVGAVRPGFSATDIYGFGYLLPALIAGKMWQKDSVALVVRPLIQTSLVGALAGSVVAWGLTIALPSQSPLGPDIAEARPLDVKADLLGQLLADKTLILQQSDRQGMDRVYPSELEALRTSLRLLIAAQERGPEDPAAGDLVARAAQVAHPIGYELVRLTSRDGHLYYYLREHPRAGSRVHGWGLYVVSARKRRDLVVEVPRPLAEWRAVHAGVALLDRLGGRALLIAGTDPRAGRDLRADVLRTPRTPFSVADGIFPRSDILQVRGAPAADAPPEDEPPPRYYFARGTLRSVDLLDVARLLGRRPVVVPPSEGHLEAVNRQRDAFPRDFASLLLGRATIERAIDNYYGQSDLASQKDVLNIDGYLLEWVQESREAIAPSGSESYRAPNLSDLYFFDQEVLRPLFRLAHEAPRDLEPALRRIAQAADQVGYELVHYTYLHEGTRFLLLREPPGRELHHRGTFVFRLGRDRPYVIEVPHPVSEKQTLEAGARLFEYLQARALFIAGASRYASAGGAADVANPRNLRTFFQLAHQVASRESPDPLLTVSVRGFAAHDRPGLDVVLSTGLELKDEVPPRLLGLAREMSQLGAQVRIFDGSLELLPFQGQRSAQWAYSFAHDPDSFTYCWLSRGFRETLRSDLVGSELDARAPVELGLPRVKSNLLVYVSALLREEERRGPAPPLVGPALHATRDAIRALGRHAETSNVVFLARAQESAREAGGELIHFTDASARREYVVFRPPPGAEAVLLAVNLHAETILEGGARSQARDLVVAEDDPALHERLTEFVRLGYRSLLVRAVPRGPGGGR